MIKEIEFRSDLWKELMAYRRKIVRSLIRKKLLLGKTKSEIRELFGVEDNYYDLDEWAYPVRKNIFLGKTFLLLNFKGEHVESIRLYRTFEIGNDFYLSI